MNPDRARFISVDMTFKETEKLEELYNLNLDTWAELELEDQEMSFEEFRNSMLKAKGKLWETKTFACEYEGRLIGYFWLYGMNMDADAPPSEKERGYFQCFVLPESRRQGIAKRMLGKIAKEAKDWGLKKLLCGGYGKDASNGFCKHFGAEMVSLELERKFKLSNANWSMIEDFSKPTSKNTNFAIELHDGNPKEQKEEYFRLYAKFCAESYAIEMEPDHDEDFTVKEMEEEDKKPPEDKDKTIIALAKTPDGKIAGLTNITIDRHNPEQSYQRITGVVREHRGKGLGLRLKAMTALHIRDNHPQVESITTFISNENKWMGDINDAMGFFVASKNEMYRFDVEELSKTLGENNES